MEPIEPTPPPPPPTVAEPRSHWHVGFTCAALVLLIGTGGVLMMRDRMMADVEQAFHTEASARVKLEKRLEGLQQSVDTVLAQPAADSSESLSALDTKFNEMGVKLDTFNARIETLERKPEPIAAAPVGLSDVTEPVATPAPAAEAVKPAGSDTLAGLKLAVLSHTPFTAELAAWKAAHADSADKAATLEPFAASGLPGEEEMNRRLREALDGATAHRKVDDTSLSGKLNTHLKGLVSIKKSGQADAYTALRRDVLREDIATLTRTVEALDTAERAPLEGWLGEAKARREALLTLDTLTGSGQ